MSDNTSASKPLDIEWGSDEQRRDFVNEKYRRERENLKKRMGLDGVRQIWKHGETEKSDEQKQWEERKALYKVKKHQLKLEFGIINDSDLLKEQEKIVGSPDDGVNYFFGPEGNTSTSFKAREDAEKAAALKAEEEKVAAEKAAAAQAAALQAETGTEHQTTEGTVNPEN